MIETFTTLGGIWPIQHPDYTQNERGLIAFATIVSLSILVAILICLQTHLIKKKHKKPTPLEEVLRVGDRNEKVEDNSDNPIIPPPNDRVCR
jgi:hypothetical protein